MSEHHSDIVIAICEIQEQLDIITQLVSTQKSDLAAANERIAELEKTDRLWKMDCDRLSRNLDRTLNEKERIIRERDNEGRRAMELEDTVHELRVLTKLRGIDDDEPAAIKRIIQEHCDNCEEAAFARCVRNNEIDEYCPRSEAIKEVQDGIRRADNAITGKINNILDSYTEGSEMGIRDMDSTEGGLWEAREIIRTETGIGGEDEDAE